jgi:hypothetical protein
MGSEQGSVACGRMREVVVVVVEAARVLTSDSATTWDIDGSCTMSELNKWKDMSAELCLHGVTHNDKGIVPGHRGQLLRASHAVTVAHTYISWLWTEVAASTVDVVTAYDTFSTADEFVSRRLVRFSRS